MSPNFSKPNQFLYFTYLYYIIYLLQLAFLPFAYVMDSWRWKLFTGEIDNTNMNEAW